jgi:RNA polymerase sigma factor (sigma-70 family)
VVICDYNRLLSFVDFQERCALGLASPLPCCCLGPGSVLAGCGVCGITGLWLRELTERELIKGCLAGERRCQETLYSRYARRMYAVCLRYARHELEAQDLMQEGFIRVFEKLKDFRMDGSFEGWIRRIMVHTSINQYRKKSFQQERFGLERIPDGIVESSAVGDLGEQELLAMVASLPDGYRMVFNLYAIEGYDHAEIAEMLGCGESTSRSQLAKARRLLQLKINVRSTPAYAGQAPR